MRESLMRIFYVIRSLAFLLLTKMLCRGNAEEERSHRVSSLTGSTWRFRPALAPGQGRGRVAPHWFQCVTSSTGRRFGCAQRPRAG